MTVTVAAVAVAAVAVAITAAAPDADAVAVVFPAADRKMCEMHSLSSGRCYWYMAVSILIQQQQLLINQLVITVFYSCYDQLVLGTATK